MQLLIYKISHDGIHGDKTNGKIDKFTTIYVFSCDQHFVLDLSKTEFKKSL